LPRQPLAMKIGNIVDSAGTKLAEHEGHQALLVHPDILRRIELSRQAAQVSCSQHDAQIILPVHLAR